jgi:hypothetical protein
MKSSSSDGGYFVGPARLETWTTYVNGDLLPVSDLEVLEAEPAAACSMMEATASG